MLPVGLLGLFLVGSVHFVHSSLITVQLDLLALDGQSPPCRIKHRINATNNHAVWILPRETLNVNFCLQKAMGFAIHGISYSNDGGGDTLTVTLDGEVKGEVNSIVRSTGGDNWNHFLNSGQIGDVVLLDRGPHEIVLNLTFADRLGLELDSLALDFQDNVLPFDLRCFTSPKQWGHNSNIKRTCKPPENWTMKPLTKNVANVQSSSTTTSTVKSTSGTPTTQLPVQQTSRSTEQTTILKQLTPDVRGTPNSSPPITLRRTSSNRSPPTTLAVTPPNTSSPNTLGRAAQPVDLMQQRSAESGRKPDVMSLVVTLLMFAITNFIL